jgi:SPP1 gp7 family putative phage head morphogenesis protein
MPCLHCGQEHSGTRYSGGLRYGGRTVPVLARDRETRSERAAFSKVRNAEVQYAIQLRKIARQIAEFIKATGGETAEAVDKLQRALRHYSILIKPWAENVTQRMLDDVRRRDERAWRTLSQNISAGVREELLNMPTGEIYRQLMGEQVGLITSLPLDAAQRVHEIVSGNLYSGERPKSLIEEIMRTGEVTKSRATLIARTETARASSVFVQSRAEYIGSEGYIWKTVKDAAVRTSHKKMQGTFVRWDSPPTLDGMTGHAGAVANCRCHCEPVIPDKYFE